MRNIEPLNRAPALQRRRLRVALFADERFSVVRDFLRGFYRYVRPAHDWLVLQGKPIAEELDAVLEWSPDYIVAPSTNRSFKLLDAVKVPVLYFLSSAHAGARIWFRPDEAAVGAAAARHLLECGYRNAAYVYDSRHESSRTRAESFADVVSKAGLEAYAFEERVGTVKTGDARQFTMEDPLMREWIESLPDSTGVYAWNDSLALWVTEVCFRLGIRIPDSIGVVGTDNQPGICLRPWPAMDSVMLPYEEIGRAVGHWIARSAAGDSPAHPDPFPVSGVFRRKSTRIQSAQNDELGAFFGALQDTPLNSLSVSVLVSASGMSRRTLERRVREHAGTTVNLLIERRRMEEAEYLLANTDRTVGDITQACGFATTRSLELLFKKYHGTTPAAYGKVRRATGA